MRRTYFKPKSGVLLGATLAAAAVCPVTTDPALAEDHRLPDAEIFAASTTAVITDPADLRLNDRLVNFKRQVKLIIRRRGARPRGSQLLDGVFFSSILGITTFQRSRDFNLDRVSRTELHDIAETIRRRFNQQSVLTERGSSVCSCSRLAGFSYREIMELLGVAYTNVNRHLTEARAELREAA